LSWWEAAASVRQAHHDPVHASGTNDRRDVVNRADDAGIEHRRSHPRLIDTVDQHRRASLIISSSRMASG
jgi:hypothetical protein